MQLWQKVHLDSDYTHCNEGQFIWLGEIVIFQPGMENLTLEKSGVCQCIAQHIQVREKYIFILFWKGALFF